MNPRKVLSPPRQTLWQLLTIGFPKRRHTRVYRLPQFVTLLWTAALVLTLTTLYCVTTGGVIALGLCAWFAFHFGRLHRLTRQCLSVERASQLLGCSQLDMEQNILDRGIEPRYVVDDVPVFHPSQLSQATVLLRPVHSDNIDLLRSIEAHGVDDSALVRATARDYEPAVRIAGAEVIPHLQTQDRSL